MEILSPGGSLESVKASVLSGANAVYIGFGDFNARRSAKNFTEEEFAQAVEFCKKYGVLVYVTMNILLSDRELKSAIEFIKTLAKLNIDAVIVQDLGVLALIKKVCPTLEVHASTQLTVHNLDGAIKAKELGFSRVVLSRELSYENIKEITEKSGVETEVFVHGALCMSYSGQCYFSAMIGSRSGNRGLCAQPCRLPYAYDDEKKTCNPLSLKDLSLVNHIRKLKEIGVSSLKIEGRMKRPEYTAIVTKIYSDVIKEDRQPTRDEIEVLEQVFSRQGFTEGYFNDEVDEKMFGIKQTPSDLSSIYKNISENLQKTDINYDVEFEFYAKCDQPIKLIAKYAGNVVECLGEASEIAINRATTTEQVEQNLLKTGGTIFNVSSLKIELDDGLMIRMSSINAVRREALEKLEKLKVNLIKHEVFDVSIPKNKDFSSKKPKFTVEITEIHQITDEMYKNKPEILYIPLLLIEKHNEKVSGMIENGFNIVCKLPKIAKDDNIEEMKCKLNFVKNLGITKLLVSNIGFIYEDFEIYGDFGLNVYNSFSLEKLAELGVKQQTLSFELKMAQIRDLNKSIKTEIFAYGHQPLMVFENCAIKNKENACTCHKKATYLTDRKDERFRLLPEFGCKNTLLNSKPLYILDKIKEFSTVDYFRLYFTEENASKTDEIYKKHINNEAFECDYTRGLYYRGVL